MTYLRRGPVTKRISATRAKAEFSSLVSRVERGGEHFVIERHGKPVAALVSIEEMGRIEEGPAEEGQIPPYVGVLAGIVSDEEIDDFLKEVYEARDRDMGRPVDIDL